MQDYIDNINTRFDIVFKTDTDREFYQSLYHYFEYIHKTPALKTILDKSESEYHFSFGEIWRERKKYNNKEELYIKSAEVIKLERFNLYSLGCFIEGRIYLPIDDYRNTNEPDDKQDPVAVILIKGLEHAISLKKWTKKTLKMHNRWFDGKRNEYELDLRRFHLMFLEELAKIKEPIQNKMSVDFHFDTSAGTFRYNKIDGILSPKSREFNFLKILYVAPDHTATYKELSDNPETVSKNDKIVLTETVKIVKRKLGILPRNKKSNVDVIKNISKYGYKLDI